MITIEDHSPTSELSKKELAQAYLERVEGALESLEVQTMLVRYNAIKEEIVRSCEVATSKRDAAERVRNDVIKAVDSWDITEIQKFVDNPPLVQAFMAARGDQSDLDPVYGEGWAINTNTVVISAFLDSFGLAYVLKDLDPNIKQDLIRSVVEAIPSSSGVVGVASTPDIVLSSFPIIENDELEILKSNAKAFHTSMFAGRELTPLLTDDRIRAGSNKFFHAYGGGPQYLVTSIIRGEAFDFKKIHDIRRSWLASNINKGSDPEKIVRARKILLGYFMESDPGTSEEEAARSVNFVMDRALAATDS